MNFPRGSKGENFLRIKPLASVLLMLFKLNVLKGILLKVRFPEGE